MSKNNTAKKNSNNNNNNNNNKNNGGIFGNLGFGNETSNKTGNNNSGNNSGKGNSGNNISSAKEEAGVYEVVTENYFLLLGIVSALVLLMIIYFFSETFRIDRTLSKMEIYQGFQRLQSLKYDTMGANRLGDCYIASAYNAAHCGYQMYDYTSEKIVLGVLQSGARYLEFNVFNSEFGDKAFPVVSMGYKKGEWKMMAKDTPLEKIFEIIKNNAFKITDGKEGVPNPEDPIFIGLNLNTNSNLDCLNLIAYLITKYFGDRLLPNEYSFQNSDEMANMKLTDVMEKVVFFASDGFQGSGLEEIVNYMWEDYSWDRIKTSKNNTNPVNPEHRLRRIHYSTLLRTDFDADELFEFNKTKGLTIIVPHEEGDFFNSNYNTSKAFDTGCQFIAMEYQYIDGNMDTYITRFKNNSIVLKDEGLRKQGSRSVRTTQPAEGTATTRPGTTQPGTTRPATTRPATTRPAATATTRRA